MKLLYALTCITAAFIISSCSDIDGQEGKDPVPEISEATFAKGADISWVTEMEADGVRFFNTKGEETDCFLLMKELGMNAIRLRVWVNPENAYGKYSDMEDVVIKARRAKDAGMELMIDFHYSDFFADPSRQTKPAAWKNLSMQDLMKAVSDHTTAVLDALWKEGISPRWIQIGNETRNGMLWKEGQLWTSSGDLKDGWANYVALSNAGYDAAKAVFPDASVLVHQNNAWEDLAWWFTKFSQAGGKYDMIGLSHYPQSETDKDWKTVNSLALSHITSLGRAFGRNVMIVETGVKTQQNETEAAKALAEFLTEAKKLDRCAGVFYWEPQTDGSWKPDHYDELSWRPYDMGAFRNGRPTSVLDTFKD